MCAETTVGGACLPAGSILENSGVVIASMSYPFLQELLERDSLSMLRTLLHHHPLSRRTSEVARLFVSIILPFPSS